MSKVRFVGLDVHAETIAIAVAEPDGEGPVAGDHSESGRVDLPARAVSRPVRQPDSAFTVATPRC
jgi:hypothetical protein